MHALEVIGNTVIATQSMHAEITAREAEFRRSTYPPPAQLTIGDPSQIVQ